MSEGFMKSALERALERAERIEVPEGKIEEMEYLSQGERIAAAFLRDLKYDLEETLRGYDVGARTPVSKGVESIFLQNLTLPRKERDKAGNDKAMEGLFILKKNKEGMRRAKEQLENLSNYYLQARKQNYEQLRVEFERAMNQAIQQQTGMSGGVKFNVEQSPEFQEKWRQLSGQLDAEYDKVLAQLKQEIKGMS